MEENIKIYTTKFALTQGIQEYNAIISGNIAIVKHLNMYDEYFHTEGRQWHRTKESAIRKAKEMQTSKIRVLNKQIQKISNLIFK